MPSGKLSVRNVLIDAIGGLAQEELGFATKRDAVLAISFTPYASETVALAQAAAARNVPIVAITDSGFSPLASLGRNLVRSGRSKFRRLPLHGGNPRRWR